MLENKLHYNIDSFLRDISHISLEEINFGHGLLLDIDGYKCIVTCSHIVGKANMKITISLNDELDNVCTEQCKLVLNIEEYEIAVLKLENENNEKKYMFQKSIKNEINFELQHKISYKSFEGFENNLTLNELDISKIYVKQQNIKNVYMPSIPCIVIESNYLPDDLHGLSGSSIVNVNDETIAIISNTISNTNKLNCIPVLLINKFIVEWLNNKKKQPVLSSIFISFDDICSEYENKQITCKYVTNTNNLTYQSVTKKKFKFEMGDVIYKVNDMFFNSDGTIFHSEIGLNLELNTYIMMENLKESFVKFDIFRIDNKQKYQTISTNLFGIPIESVYNIRMCNKNDYLIFKRHIFTELSFELLIELIKENIVSSKVFDNNIIKLGNYESQKIIIIFDGKTPMVVEKIGNKKINSLEDMKQQNIDKNINISCKTFFGKNIKVAI